MENGRYFEFIEVCMYIQASCTLRKLLCLLLTSLLGGLYASPDFRLSDLNMFSGLWPCHSLQPPQRYPFSTFFFFFQLLQPWCKESLSLQKSSAAPRLPSLQTFKNNHDSMNVKLLTPRLPLGKFRLSTDSVLYHHSSYPPPDHHHQKKNSMCFLQQWGKLIPYWGGEPTKYKSSVVKNKTLCRVVQSQAKDFYLI